VRKLRAIFHRLDAILDQVEELRSEWDQFDPSQDLEELLESWHAGDPRGSATASRARADAAAVLGVPVTATAEEIRRAYRVQARACHPDVPGGSAVAFQAVTHARDLMLDGAL
jgi:DnaJ-domain-containing protein 1